MAYEQLKLDNQICFRLYTASRLITQAYTPYFKKMGITYPQYLVLLLLWEHDNCVVSDITERLKLETNTITPLLQRMEKQGLIVRNKGLVDTRQRIVSLTPQGKRLEEQAQSIPKCLVSELASKGLNTNNLATLAPLLDNVIDAMQK